MKAIIPILLACALVVVAALIRANRSTKGGAANSENQAAVQKPLGTPRLSALTPVSSPEEAPLSPEARMLLAELTATIEQGESGRILAEQCREAGVRALDFLELASVIMARDSMGRFAH